MCLFQRQNLCVLQSFCFYHSWVEVIPCKNQLAIAELAICGMFTHTDVCVHTQILGQSFSLNTACVQVPVDTAIHRNVELEEYELS